MFFKKINFYNNILCCFSILIFLFLLYEYIIFSTNDFKIIFYLILTLILILFFLIVSFLPNDLKKKVFTLYLSIFLSLYLVEFFLNFYGKYDELNQIVDKYELYEEKINTYKTLREKFSDNVYFYVQNLAAKKNLQMYPLSGIRDTHTIHCKENGYYSTYESDRYGFNNPDEIWDNLSHDIVLIGDSFVHGACVFREFTFAGNFRKISRSDKRILNLGWSGSGPLQEYATLKEYYKKFTSKNVIWFFFENDFVNLTEELENNILIRYLEKNFTQDYFSKIENYENILKNIHNSDLEKIKDYLVENKFFYNVKKNTFLSFFLFKKTQNLIFNFVKFKIHNENNIGNHVYNKFNLILKASVDLTKKNGGNFYFVFLPSIKRYKNNSIEDSNYSKLRSIIKKQNINFIDVNKEIKNLVKDPLSLYSMKKNSHYSPEGYKLISDLIYKKIFK